MLRRKIFSLVPQISQQPHLLSHFIHELIIFDTSLKDDWNYDGGSGLDGWKGLAWEVLVMNDWFGRWLEVEKECKHILKLVGSRTLMRMQLLWPGIKRLLRNKTMENWTTIAWNQMQPNLRRLRFESMISLRLSQVHIPCSRLDNHEAESYSTLPTTFLFLSETSIFDRHSNRHF